MTKRPTYRVDSLQGNSGKRGDGGNSSKNCHSARLYTTARHMVAQCERLCKEEHLPNQQENQQLSN